MEPKKLDPNAVLGCPLCSQPTLVKEHGICRSRKNGRNLYCRGCVRVKVTAQRQAARAIRATQDAARQRRLLEGLEPIEVNESSISTADLQRKPDVKARGQRWRLTPADRLIVALREGCRTREEIKRRTKLTMDEVCDLLAELSGWDIVQAPKQPHIFLLRDSSAESVAV